MLAKFLEALRTLNTGMSALQWLWAALLLVLPASVIGALYALRDDLWQRYGALGLALLILFAIMAVGVGCAGAAVLVYVRRPAPAPEKPKLPPDLPTHTMSILDAIKRIGSNFEESKRPGEKKFEHLVHDLYEALQSGHIKAWGQHSATYPPSTKHPRSPRVYIDPLFWRDSTIEELDLLSAETKLNKSRGWEFISLPDAERFKRRELVACYWNIVLDPYDVRRRWPLSNDWMSA